MDEELSVAVVAYLSRGRSPFPRIDRDAVRAVATRQEPDELLEAVEALVAEAGAVPVDWSAGFAAACDHVRAVVAARHPELSPAAVDALDWHFSYVSR